MAHPGFRSAKPFVLDYPQQFRPPPPPPLRTKAYARALREVQEYGAAGSTRRTNEQTAYAIWWMEFAEGSVNRLARQLSTDRRTHLWKVARMFAHVGVALYDTYIATWDAKYAYDHWRPYTAIRAADTDENPNTQPDRDWEPLRPTPPFPEYSSAHAAGLRRVVRRARRCVRTRCAVHHGNDNGSPWYADTRVRQLRRGGRRVC